MRAYERLLKYVQIASASDPKSQSTPSSEGIWEMAHLLKKRDGGDGTLGRGA